MFVATQTIRGRLLILLALCALAITWPGYLALNHYYEKSRFSSRASAGVPVAQTLLDAIRFTQQHRGLAGVWLAGDGKNGERRDAAHSAVNDAVTKFDALIKADAAQSHRVGKSWQAAYERWQALQRQVGGRTITPKESWAAHSALISSMLAVLGDVADHWELSFDPTAQTYFLHLVVMHQTPEMIELMGQARGRGTAILSTQSTDPYERAVLDSALSQLDVVLGHARATLAKASATGADTSTVLAEPTRRLAALGSAAIALANDHILNPSGKPLPAQQYFDESTKLIDGTYATTSQVMAVLAENLSRDAANSKRNLWIIASLLVLLAVGSATYALWVSHSIVRQLGAEPQTLSEIAETVSHGDLTRDIPLQTRSPQSVLAALARMQDRLVRTVSDVRVNAEAVASASTQIAQGNQDLSARTEQQSSALQVTASSMEEVGVAVQHNADNSREADRLARHATDVAASGGRVVQQAIDAMRAIDESSRRINEITSVIDSIAFQTNILALNAAVEAARAGEQGRGFAVVASEVRALAQRSAEAAREIKTLIATSTERVEQGSTHVQEAGRTMQEVVTAIGRVSEMVGSISIASDQQRQGVQQVGDAVSELDHGTQHNAALVEETAAAAESLRHQAVELVRVVSAFKLNPAARQA